MDEDGSEAELNIVGTLLKEDLNEEEEESEVHQACRRLIEDVWRKRYERKSVANARKHSWRDEAHTEVDLAGTDQSIKEIFESLKDDDEFENNSENLAQLFISQVREVPNNVAVLDLLIITHFVRGGNDFVSVIKTPYIDDAHNVNPDAEEVLVQNERVIREEIDKSILYPRHDGVEEEVDESKVQVFQKRGSSHWADYWYEFIELEVNSYPDEQVENQLKERATEGDSESAFPSYSSFTQTDFNEEYGDGFEKGTVSVKFAGEQLRLPIEKIKEDDRVKLARSQDNDQYYLILSDSNPEITVGQSSSEKSLFGELSDLPVINNIFQ